MGRRSTSSLRASIATLCVAALLALAGCGGDDAAPESAEVSIPSAGTALPRELRDFDVITAEGRAPSGYQPQAMAGSIPAPEQDPVGFTTVIEAELGAYWQAVFNQVGQSSIWAPPTVYVVDAAVETGCQAVIEPDVVNALYCGFDESIYIPLAIFSELAEAEGIVGDAAIAAVIAHEYGHHIQNRIGVFEGYFLRRYIEAERAGDEHGMQVAKASNEVMADCLAGKWFNNAYWRQMLEAGDLEEAQLTFYNLGDDAVAARQGQVFVLDHGTSQNRHEWFTYGYNEGLGADCLAAFASMP